MRSPGTHFQLTYNLSMIDVEQQTNGLETVYKLRFSNEVPEMVLLSFQQADGIVVWDSIPPGNTELASSLGKLIEQYHESVGDDRSKKQD